MGEMEEDEAKQDFLLPPKQEIGRHCNGVKNVIEYRFYGKGEEVANLKKPKLLEIPWPNWGKVVQFLWYV